jgi:hypothetical protein
MSYARFLPYVPYLSPFLIFRFGRPHGCGHADVVCISGISRGFLHEPQGQNSFPRRHTPTLLSASSAVPYGLIVWETHCAKKDHRSKISTVFSSITAK